MVFGDGSLVLDCTLQISSVYQYTLEYILVLVPLSVQLQRFDCRKTSQQQGLSQTAVVHFISLFTKIFYMIPTSTSEGVLPFVIILKLH